MRFKHNDDEFWQTLQARVNAYFREGGISPYWNSGMALKIGILFLAFVLPYLVLLFGNLPGWAMLLCCVLLGLSMAGIGLAVSHQAVHNAISPNKYVNRLFGLSFNMLGMSDYIWKIKHNVYHHTYTNVFEKDEALREGDLIRMSRDAPYKAIHRKQHIYSFFVYAIFTIFWAFALDFEKFFRYRRNGSEQSGKGHSWQESALFFGTKIYYVFVAFILPHLVAGISYPQIILGFIVVHIIASLIVTHVLQVEHLVEQTTHVTPDAEGMIHRSWAVNQLEGTSNFKANNFLFEWYLGGSNYQIEHHLFPKICAVHYPALSKIIRQTASEYQLDYHVFESFPQALKAHYQFLKELGSNELELNPA